MFTCPITDAPNMRIRDGVKLYRFASSGLNQEQSNGYIDMIGDYSDTGNGLTEFKIQPAENQTFWLFTMHMHLRATGKIDSGFYGNNLVLTNGIHFGVDGDELPPGGILFTAPKSITTNTDYEIYGAHIEPSNFGSGDETLRAELNFSIAGSPTPLYGSKHQKFFIRLNDDFSDLVHQYFLFRGLRFGSD